MNREKKNNKLNRFIVLGIIVMLMLSLFIPVGYQLFIVGNGVESKWSEEVWGGFLGSLWGGIIGGAGTLFAVLITTIDTRKIQSRNEESRAADKVEAERLRIEDKLEFEETRKSDKADVDRRERKAFADDIIEYIGKYITNISIYFYSNLSSERDDRELRAREEELQNKEKELVVILEEMSKMGMDDVDKLIEKEKIQHKLTLEADILLRKVQGKQAEIKEHKADRTIANECYFVLQMKLDKIDIAQVLLNQLSYIHKELFDQDLDWIDIESKKLMEISEQFVIDYVA